MDLQSLGTVYLFAFLLKEDSTASTAALNYRTTLHDAQIWK
jgi:hypothetical protein